MTILKPALFFLLPFVILACAAPVEEETETVETPETAPAISSEQTQEVINHHLASFGANDLEAILSDYTDESVLITPDSTFTGLEQIKGMFTGLLPAFPTEGTDFQLDNMVINNELAYIVWHATTPAVDVPLGTDTFIVIDGKIIKQTFAGVINPVESTE